MKLPTFQDIAAITAGAARPYVVNEQGSLQMQGRHHPFSITETEFGYIARHVAAQGRQRGFEIGTGLGISALAAAFGMRETGGLIVTMDCYIESQLQDCFAYENATTAFPEAPERETIRLLVEHFGLQVHLAAEVGLSPRDVAATVRKHFGESLCDYGFLDAEHRDHALEQDMLALGPHLAPFHTCFLHDADMYRADLVARFQLIPECLPPHGWHLAVYDL